MSAFSVSEGSDQQPGDFFEDAELPEVGGDEPVIAKLAGDDPNALIDGFVSGVVAGLRDVFYAAATHCVPDVPAVSKKVAAAVSEVSRRLGF